MVWVWNLRVALTVAKDTVISSTNNIITEFKKVWNFIEKSLNSWAEKWLEKIRKESEVTVVTISKLNNQLWQLQNSLNHTEIWSKRFKELQNEIKKTEKELSKAVDTTWIFQKTFWGLQWFIAGAFAVTWITQLASWIISLWANLEQAQIAFTTMLWSWQKANTLLKDLSNFAKTTPFEITWLRDTAKQLLAFWINSEEIIPTLKSLWDVSAGLSVPIEQIAYAYWQVKVAWRLMWWELMQFTNAWVPLIAELSKNLWIAQSKIKDMVSDWKIWFKDVEEAFRTMSSEWGAFANMMDKQSNSVAWLWSNLKDTITQLWESIWTTFIPIISSVLQSILKFTTDFPLLTKTFWILSITLLWLGWVFWIVTPIIWAFTGAVSLASIWLLPIIWTIWLVLGAVWWLWVGIYALSWWFDENRKKADELSDSQKKLNEITSDYTWRVQEAHNKQEELNKKFIEWSIWNEEYKKSTEANSKALEDMAKNQEVVQEWLDIIQNKQLDYKQKVEMLNKLKLNSSEYSKLISYLQSVQQETLKAIQLQQQLLKSKIASLKEPTVELKKASAELNNAYNKVLTTWEWSLSTNRQNNLNFQLENWKFVIKQTQEQIKAQKEYEKQVKISNEKNSVEISKYNAELKQLQEQEQKLVNISRQAQDLIKKPSTSSAWSSWWWSWSWGWSSESKNKQELDRQTKLLEEKAKKEIESVKKSELTELEKAKAILKINDDLEKDINVLKSNTIKNDLERAKETVKNEKEKTQEQANLVKQVYNVYEDKRKKLKETTEKYYKNALDYQNNIDESIWKTQRSLRDLNTEYEKNIKLIELERTKRLNDEKTWTEEKVAERLLEIEKEKTDLQKELKDIQKDNANANVNRINWLSKETLEAIWKWDLWWVTGDELLKVYEINEKINKLNKEEIEAKKIVNDKVLETKRIYQDSSEIQKILIDQQKQIAKINEDQDKKINWDAENGQEWIKQKYEKEKAELEEYLRVYDIFLTSKKLTQEQYDKMIQDERFQKMSNEEQDLIMKLAKEKILLTNQKDEIISLEEDVQKAKIALSLETTELLKNDVSDLSNEYKKLISDIQIAINEQKKLNALKSILSSDWNKLKATYSEWWYTGDGWKYEPAGIVHKWEYVVPQSVISKMPEIVPKLETLRQWWSISNDYSKKIDVWGIVVQNQADLELFFEKQKWRL